MVHYIVELALWILAAYFVGCVIGALLHGVFGSAESEPVAESEAVMAEPAPMPVEPVVEAEPVVAAVARMDRPRGVAEARDGKPDALQRISGIGPKNERVLHNLGFYHFDQIAAWSDEQVAWVDDHLKFNGRAVREKWVMQARLLANGEEDEFKRQFGTGGYKTAAPKTE